MRSRRHGTQEDHEGGPRHGLRRRRRPYRPPARRTGPIHRQPAPHRPGARTRPGSESPRPKVAYEPDLAASLSNLGIRLAEVGRRAEALAAEQEAVEIYRRLAKGNPAAYEPDLATSLTVFAMLLAAEGDLAEVRFPRDAEEVDSGSDGTHERTCDHGCT
ncbi:tetratricopeptide repeat protein, partial [Streptomyces scabiei]|uniref:tetratricopeptide repeat protein n=1 Tax=Streptomyces scabiei TaxID=1930 RepID=UPI00398839C6